MNKKIILSMAASMLLASSVFAFGGQGDSRKSCSQKNGQHKMMMKKGGHHKKDGRIMKMLMMLDLNDKQRTEIKQIVQDSMEDISNPYSAFSSDDFDKTKFIKLVKEKRDGKIEKKAEVISKIYAVLNSSQKKDLKTMIDMKEMMKKRMMKRKMMQKGDCNGKNCNGRR